MPRELTRAQLATQAWTQMSELVHANDRMDELRERLNLGRGSGRVRTLLGLADGPLSLGDLADATGTDGPYITLIINELLARGLVTRTLDPDDRRRKLVALTEAGEEAVATAREILNRPPPSFLGELSKPQLAELADLVGRLVP